MKSKTFKRMGLIGLWAASLILVAQWGHTQTAKPPQNLFDVPLGAVISGNDIGFRVEGFNRGVVPGTWMVKVGAAWAPTGSPATTKPAGN
jgi:hypothetical protein